MSWFIIVVCYLLGFVNSDRVNLRKCSTVCENGRKVLYFPIVNEPQRPTQNESFNMRDDTQDNLKPSDPRSNIRSGTTRAHSSDTGGKSEASHTPPACTVSARQMVPLATIGSTAPLQAAAYKQEITFRPTTTSEETPWESCILKFIYLTYF